MKKRIFVAILLIAVAFLITFFFDTFFENKNKVKTQRVSFTRECFGTVFTITIDNLPKEKAKKLIDECYAMCEDMEKNLSPDFRDSELARVNTSLNKPIKVSDEVFYIVKKGIEYNAITEGAFDITLGRVIHMWGIGTDHEHIVSDEELEDYKDINGCQYLLLDEENHTITRLDDRVKIDLGAIAKGYAANRVREYIYSNYSDAIGVLDFGGNIYAIGKKNGKTPWNIGITDPFNTIQMIGYVKVFNCSVVTSGNYERFFIEDGVRYHHIIDPKTAKPSDSGVVCATIIGRDSMKCDILSTAAYVLGVEKALVLLENIDGVEAIIVDEAGHIYTTTGIDKYDFVKY